MKKILSKNLFVIVLGLFTIFSTVLCSCGFKGPLYLPKKVSASNPQSSQPHSASNSITLKAPRDHTTTNESGSLREESSIIK
ncbi:MAG: hypothetical protein K0R94_131 [Burkholderiales bacterium]|jgi:predicted small lipoprotein YifL|nr:hypothetical protein [Burkholderiales bacterium]